MKDLLRPACTEQSIPSRGHARERKSFFPATRRISSAAVCETGDCFLHDWPLGKAKPGTYWRFGLPARMEYRKRQTTMRDAVRGGFGAWESLPVIRRREVQRRPSAHAVF